MNLFLVRFLFILVVAVTCFLIQPFNLPANLDAAVGALVGLAIVLFESRLRRTSLTRLIGAAIGSVLGIVGAYLFALVIRNSLPAGHTQSFLQILVMLLMAYVGLVVGANKGEMLNLGVRRYLRRRKGPEGLRSSIPALSSMAASPTSWRRLPRRRPGDSGVRAARITAGGRSADSIKRNRGRRNLDIRQREKKRRTARADFEDDFPTSARWT